MIGCDTLSTLANMISYLILKNMDVEEENKKDIEIHVKSLTSVVISYNMGCVCIQCFKHVIHHVINTFCRRNTTNTPSDKDVSS